MARISSLDHRALCLHVLAQRTSDDCRAEFVAAGGLRVLRRWMLAAIEEDRVGELRACLGLLSALPVDAESLRRCDLGRLIRRLTKHRSSRPDADELNSEAKKFVGAELE